jgi:dCMP deaminase
VIVDDHRILATGYNGSLPGAPHCDDVGHLLIDGHCKRTTHAEMNAIAQAAANGIKIGGAHIYITHSPCVECFRMILASGIRRITFETPYGLTQNTIDVYKDIAGYRTIEFGGDGKTPPTVEKYYSWNISLDTNVWYK